MKRVIFLLFLIVGTHYANAQLNEIGVFVGGSNYIGDIGSTNFINPNEFAIGALFKWNPSARYSYRISGTFASIAGNDRDSDIASRVERGYAFTNKIKELSAGIEFNFLEFDLHSFSKPATPYIYTGISYFSYKNIYFDGNNDVNYENHSTFAIPITLGFKAKVSSHLILGAEIGARYTFTDNLDGSNPVKGLKNDDSLKFGNVNSDDWYVFSGVVITYTFRRLPCFTCFDSRNAKKRRKNKLFK
ncbi:DUF6089 family protein [Abyssalbus ytuae]|uniref:DUF6089 family protein n=1 Tax=Abyssalbus ytuae TaxID=2926907 RepID=A0A9E7A0U4_9FLAO|nr:DUF6089 family protein [Abyssalbus ytuae]UOB18877.1 DUF6089 family protein [Abyssalbus ytuae]